MEVSKKRHLLKAITWRLVGSFTSFVIAYVITGDMSMGIMVGGADTVIKFIIYYIHERLWYRSRFGIKKD